jgi:tripartite-type tricarboxylate transporter receptor subunit TctC
MKHVLAMITLATLTTLAAAQPYPSRPIRMLVPMAAGAGTDIGVRILSTRLSESLHQQVVVDNRAGASGIVGAELAARAAPDGHTLMIVTISHSVSPSLHKKLPYDIIRDFTPVSLLMEYPFLLNINPALPVKTVNDLIALAKSRPGQLNYASNGAGGGAYLGAELLKSLAGINITHVPYKSTAAAIAGTVAGETNMAFYSASAAIAHVKAGRFRALAVTGKRRSPSFPELPTVAEAANLPGYEVVAWTGMLAPAGTPRPVVTRLHGEITRALQLAEVKEKLAVLDFEPVGNTPEEFGTYLKQQMAKWAKVLREAGAKAE